MMRFYTLLALLFGFFSFHTAAHAAPDHAIGRITVAVADAYVQRHNQDKEIKASVDLPVYSGDMLITHTDESYVQVDFIDQTHILLSGMDSTLTIDEYVFAPKNIENNKAEFSVLKGSFEFVGGLLDKGEDENVQINLDFGSIGIRGTKIRRSMRDGECWIFLEEGDIRVFNDGGEVFLKPGDGTRISSKDVSPTEVKPWGQKNIDWIRKETQLPQ